MSLLALLFLIGSSGLVVGFFAGVLSWQVNLVAIHRGMKYDGWAAFCTGVGAAVADATFIFVALKSGSYLADYLDSYSFLKWMGWVILVLVACYLFYYTPKEKKVATGAGNSGGNVRSILAGFSMVLGNPLILMMWIGLSGVLLGHFPGLHELAPRVFFTVGFITGSLTWFVLLTFLSRHIARGVETGMLRVYSRTCAGIILLVVLIVIVKSLF